MKTVVIFVLVGCFSVTLNQVEGVRTPSEKDTALLDDILRKITTSILNAKPSPSKGFYEVADDGSIHFVRSTTTEDSTPVSTTSAPNLSDDESVKHDLDNEEEDEEGTFWEFVPRRVNIHDPLTDEEEFPLVETNEVDTDQINDKLSKFAILERRKRDVNVDVGGSNVVDVAVNKPDKQVAVNVGGQGESDSSNVVDVAVNKPGKNVVVNVGSIQDLLGQFGIHFNGGKPSGSLGKPGPHSNVDVNVNKPGSGNTNVAVDWASFIPFVNVDVKKNHGGSKVDVNVGQSGGSNAGGSVEGSQSVPVKGHLVDVKVDGESSAATGDASSHKKVVVHAPFVNLDIDGDFPHPPPHPPHHHPHHPPKKHHLDRRHPNDDDSNVSVNVGGQKDGIWWPFVDVAVDKAPQGKAAGKKCIKINVPFVNILLNRSGCDGEQSGPTPA